MTRSARPGAPDSGFTLLEVMLALVLIAGACVTLVSIYIHIVEQASAARDETISARIARNAVNEAWANQMQELVTDLAFPERPSLFVTTQMELPEIGESLTDSIQVGVRSDKGDRIVSYALNRAIYELPPQPETGPEAGGAAADTGDDGDSGGGDSGGGDDTME